MRTGFVSPAVGANLAFAVNPLLWGSFYPITKGALGSAHPVAMIGTAMTAFLCISVLLLPSCRAIRPGIMVNAALGVMPLAAAYVTSALALSLTTATNTGVFPALTGVLAIVVSGAILRRGMQCAHIFAGCLSILGVVLMIWESSKAGGNWWGDVIALFSTVCYALYIFTCEWLTADTKSSKDIVALQSLYLGGTGMLLALMYGDFGHGSVPLEYIAAVAYIGFGTLVIPTVISLYMMRWTTPLLVAFIYILEPVWSAGFSFVYLGESLTRLGYAGAFIVLAGTALAVFSPALKRPAGVKRDRTGGDAAGAAAAITPPAPPPAPARPAPRRRAGGPTRPGR